MKLAFNLVIFVIYLTATSIYADESNDIPIMMRSKISSKDISSDQAQAIGKTISSNEFLNNYLSKLYPAGKNDKRKKIAIILVSDNLRPQGIIQNASLYGKKLLPNNYFYPSVHNAYTTLREYLDDKKFKIEIELVDSTANPFELYIKKQNDFDYIGVVLTKLDIQQTHDDAQHHHNHKRGASSSSLRKSEIDLNANNETIYIFGSSCVALLNSIRIKNSTAGIQSPVYYNLDLNIAKSDFSCCEKCADNNTAVLNLQFLEVANVTEYIASIKLTFNRFARYWRLSADNDTLVFTNLNRNYTLAYMSLPYSMETPTNYSFACTSTRFKFTNSTDPKAVIRLEVYIDGFQFQPFGINSTTGNYTFGQVNYCGGFFTNGIWMGIMTTLIMITILTAGVYLMTSINTMDRFDDPKGKQLMIAAEK